MARESWLGWSKALWKRFGAVALPVVGIPLALNRLIDLSLTAGFTAMTALLLLAYTLETQEMRREMVRQNEIAVQPLLHARVDIQELEGGRLYRKAVILRNIGFGPALFVRPQEIRDAKAAHTGVRFVARFSPVDCIEAREEAATDVTLKADVGEEGEIDLGDFIASLDPRSATATSTYDVTIAYQDLSGQERESVVRMGKGGIRLLHHGKV